MSARKPKPRKAAPRKGSKPTLEQRLAMIEAVREFDQNWLEEIDARLKSMEARAHFRDASHDEPVSNAGEAVGQHFTILSESLVKVPTKRGGWRWAWWRP